MLWRCIKDYYHDQIIFKLFFDKTTCFGLLYTTRKGVSRSQPLNNQGNVYLSIFKCINLDQDNYVIVTK